MPKKKEASKKIPKALKDILANAKKEKPPEPLLALPKGIGSASMEAASGQPSALLTMNNEGAIKQISLASPFGNPVPSNKKAPEPPLLQAEDAEEAILTPLLPKEENEFDRAWDTIAEDIAAAEPAEPMPMDPPQEPKEPTESEVNPFAVAEPENAPVETLETKKEELPVICGDGEPDANEILEQLEEQRRINQALRKQNELLASEGGSATLVEKITSLLQENERLEKEIQEKPKQTGGSLPEWKGKDLRILFPCHKFTNPATAMFLVAMALDFGRDKIGFIPALGDARISNSRSRLAMQFLETGAPWSLWIDDDMIPTFGRANMIRNFIGATPKEVPDAILEVHAIQRLMAANQKIIGATYFGRRKYSYAMFKDGIDNPSAYDKAKRHTGEVIKTDWVATGCLLVHRDVYLGIQKACPELAPTTRRHFWDFFREGDGQDGGEDVMFCERARKAGFQPYVDTGAQAFHIGSQAFGFWNTEATFGVNMNTREGKWW